VKAGGGAARRGLRRRHGGVSVLMLVRGVVRRLGSHVDWERRGSVVTLVRGHGGIWVSEIANTICKGQSEGGDVQRCGYGCECVRVSV
jgi:hypothetical protein